MFHVQIRFCGSWWFIGPPFDTKNSAAYQISRWLAENEGGGARQEFRILETVA